MEKIFHFYNLHQTSFLNGLFSSLGLSTANRDNVTPETPRICRASRESGQTLRLRQRSAWTHRLGLGRRGVICTQRLCRSMLGVGRCPISKGPTSWMGLPFGTREHKSCIQTLPGPLNPCLPILPGNSLALPTRPGWSSDSTTTIFSQVPRQEALERCSCSMGLTGLP